MWEIFERSEVRRRLKRAPTVVLERYEAWKRIVELGGPAGLRFIKGFHDEKLAGQWAGFRSSRLGIHWRVIYRCDHRRLEVHVFEVNPHDY